MSQVTLKDIIQFDQKQGNFVIASTAGLTTSDVDDLLTQFARLGTTNDLREEHLLLGQAITEPILQIVPYVRWTSSFLQQTNYGPLEDNSVPVEYYVNTAWRSHPDGEGMFISPGYGWTRPSFRMYNTNVEIKWSVLEKAGWNVLSRMMARAAEEIARKIDLDVQYVLDTAIDGAAGQGSVVSGGLLTKASVDAVIKAANGLGFPMNRAAINSGTLTDMTSWSGGPFYNASLPQEMAREIITTLHLGNYGGVEWYASPYVPASFVYFAGPANTVGYEQVRGGGKMASDVDLRKHIDLHIVMSPEYAWYVGNEFSIRRLRIAS